jgi:LAO/AO transport system kinase
VVFNPHTGDSIQTIKAGITEIGDIYLVHKSDLDGASQLFQSVQDFIGTVEKNPLILKVSSKTGKGIPEFITELKRIMVKRKKEKKLIEKEKLAKELDDIILNNINQKVATMLHSNKSYSGYLKKVQERKIDPFEAADQISNSIMK